MTRCGPRCSITTIQALPIGREREVSPTASARCTASSTRRETTSRLRRSRPRHRSGRHSAPQIPLRPPLRPQFHFRDRGARRLRQVPLVLTKALAIVTSRPLLGVTQNEKTSVWCWNGEDPIEELQRRIAVACLHYQVDRSEIEGRLFLDTGRKTKIIIAEQRRTGVKIVRPTITPQSPRPQPTTSA